MAESEPLFALLELMLRTFTNNVPKMKAGGHPEEMFLDLNDDERDEIECSICYQILRDVRQCENKHKFCYSCIFVWSTSGNPVNHSRCPVCRVEGLYVRNHGLDETINAKRVKCAMKSCKWTGALKHLSSHQHTNYSDERSSQSTITGPATELPSVGTTNTAGVPRPQSTSRSISRSSGAVASSAQTTTSSDVVLVPTRRQPLATNNNANTQDTARSTTLSRSTNAQSTTRSTNNPRTNRSTNAQNTSRTRTWSRNRQTSSTSPQRRPNVTATGLNARLTNRGRIQNNGTIENRPNNVPAAPATSRTPNTNTDENQNPSMEQTTTETIHVPRPPVTPRPVAQTPRRLPTLPNTLTARNIEPLNTDNNNNVSSTSNSNTENSESPRNMTITASVRRPGPQQRSFGTIRDRLNESRQRLDMLMSVFSTELDRGRVDLTSFQEERERRRQEQLAEVQNLGRRLTQVASELRGLLSQRRQIRGQMDTLIQSASDDVD